MFEGIVYNPELNTSSFSVNGVFYHICWVSEPGSMCRDSGDGSSSFRLVYHFTPLKDSDSF